MPNGIAAGLPPASRHTHYQGGFTKYLDVDHACIGFSPGQGARKPLGRYPHRNDIRALLIKTRGNFRELRGDRSGNDQGC
jgi:hypothetical protein